MRLNAQDQQENITWLAVAILVIAVPASGMAAPAKGAAVLPVPLPGSIAGMVTSGLGSGPIFPVPGALVVALP